MGTCSLFAPCEDTLRKGLSASQEQSTHRVRPGWHLDLGLQPPEPKENKSLLYSIQSVVFCDGSLSGLKEPHCEFWADTNLGEHCSLQYSQ